MHYELCADNMSDGPSPLTLTLPKEFQITTHQTIRSVLYFTSGPEKLVVFVYRVYSFFFEWYTCGLVIDGYWSVPQTMQWCHYRIGSFFSAVLSECPKIMANI